MRREDSVIRTEGTGVEDDAPPSEDDMPARSSLLEAGVTLRELSGDVVNVGIVGGVAWDHAIINERRVESKEKKDVMGDACDSRASR